MLRALCSYHRRLQNGSGSSLVNLRYGSVDLQAMLVTRDTIYDPRLCKFKEASDSV